MEPWVGDQLAYRIGCARLYEGEDSQEDTAADGIAQSCGRIDPGPFGREADKLLARDRCVVAGKPCETGEQASNHLLAHGREGPLDTLYGAQRDVDAKRSIATVRRYRKE